MSWHVILGVAGAFCGMSGSIITAFSANAIFNELYLAQEFLSVTTEAFATGQRDVPVFTGTDRRFERAQRRSAKIVWLGVALLALGFVLQGVSTALGG
jgi:hypothetical protein